MSDNSTYPEVGQLDELEVFLGQRGTGKSVHMCLRTLEGLHRWGGGYVIGHSLGARLPEKLPPELGGQELPIVYHANLERLAHGLRRHPERWHILSPPLPHEWGDRGATTAPDTADDLLRYAVRLSAASRLRAYRREHPVRGALVRDPSRLRFTGLRIPPIYVLVDEGIAVEGAAASKTKEQSRAFLQFLYSLRHMQIALMWSIQDPNARSWQLMAQATLVHVHHVKHMWAVNAIQAAGASDSELERIETLRGYDYVTIEVSSTQRQHSEAEGAQEKQAIATAAKDSDAEVAKPPPTSA